MNVTPPRVPPAAQVAGSAQRGPRVVPGTYTVRMTKGTASYETKVTVGLDPRSPFTAAERQEQFDAAMAVRAMFGDMTDLVARIQAVRAGAGKSAAGLPEGDALKAQLVALSDGAETVRKQIVATKEGGAITGEERLREHMDDLYGGIMSYEGRPSATLVAYTSVLRRQLSEVAATFDAFCSKDVGAANAALKAKGLPEITGWSLTSK
jgi:hypothetical protein